MRHPGSSRKSSVSVVVACAAAGLLGAGSATAADSPLGWRTVANQATAIPSQDATFNAFNQPSVNQRGYVAFRGRSKGPRVPTRGIYGSPATSSFASIDTLFEDDFQVPPPNNLEAKFNEFPAFPRIDALVTNVVTRGQSGPVYRYLLPDDTETRVGTSGVYLYSTSKGGDVGTGIVQVGPGRGAAVGTVVPKPSPGRRVTAASQLGNVPGFPWFAVPGVPGPTRFDQFPGSPSVDREVVAFKGNFTYAVPPETSGRTGVYFRDAATDDAPVQRIADSISTLVPGTDVVFGSTAPPSAAGGKVVFAGFDDEENPTVGGIYLAPLAPDPPLSTLVRIGDPVPGPDGVASAEDRFDRFGEALSFDGRFVSFWGAWGDETRSFVLDCPEDGNADLVAFCREHYPNGFEAVVPLHQGIFVQDLSTGRTVMVAETGERYADFLFWVFSGRPPGAGEGGDEGGDDFEPPRWRASSFAAVAPLGSSSFTAAFKALRADGGQGVYLASPSTGLDRPVAAAETGMSAASIDPKSPPGTLVTVVGLEREGLRGNGTTTYLALAVSMETPAGEEEAVGWAGVYRSQVPSRLPGL